MKHPLIFVALLVVTAASISAQNTFPSSGNVGIGTTTPTVRKLQLYEAGSNVSAGIMVESAGTAGFENADLLLKTTGRLWQITNGKVNPANGLAIVDVTAGVARFAIDTSGNVGIGTVSPGKPLDVVGTIRAYTDGFGGRLTFGYGNATDLVGSQAADGSASLSFNLWNGTTNFTTLFLKGSGNVGIGTTSPGAHLEVRGAYGTTGTGGDIYSNSENSYIGVDAGLSRMGFVKQWGNYPVIAAAADTPIIFGSFSIPNLLGAITASTGFSERMRITSAGNVGIGTTNPTQKLSVNGTIRAKEVIVDTGWSDYVFADDYTLAPLSEVEAHIKAHHTLPGVPSEAQVAKEGISLGDMQAKLLAKIEELTLHQIDQEKRMAGFAKENAELRREVQSLKETR